MATRRSSSLHCLFVLPALLALVAADPAPSQADMTLTPEAATAGFTLSTFATNFPNDGVAGPVGIAFPGSGVMVSDFPGHVRVFPTHADGQDAATVTAVAYDFNEATGIAELAGKFYLAQRTSGRVAEIDAGGAFKEVVVGGLPLALGILGDPFTGRLFVATTNATNAAIYDVDPVAKTATVFANVDADGLALSADGGTLYAAVQRQHIVGFATATKTQVFDSGTISYVDGPALGIGSLAGKLFANVNDGTVWEVDLATGAQTLLASGGSRGDLVAVDPDDGTLLLTQTDRIVRLQGPPPCGKFGVASLRLTPSAATGPVGEAFTVTASASVNGRPAAGVLVTDTVTGANAAMGTCTTGADGTCTFAYTGSNPGTDTITASGALCTESVTATATRTWCDAETSARIKVDGECQCATASNHGAYVHCVAHAVKAAGIAKSLSGTVKRCAARSTCGKPGFVTCCRTNKKGVTKCSIKHDAAKCKAPKGGSAHVGTHASCCDACTSPTCFVGAVSVIALD